MVFETHEWDGVVFLRSFLLPVPHTFSIHLGGVSPRTSNKPCRALGG